MNELWLSLAKQIEVGRFLLWTGVGLVGVIAASLVVLAYRRRVLGPQTDDKHTGLMEELREMLKRGEISEEEFSAAKHAMVSRLSGQAKARPAPAVRKGERVAKPGFDLTGQPLPKQPPSTPGV